MDEHQGSVTTQGCCWNPNHERDRKQGFINWVSQGGQRAGPPITKGAEPIAEEVEPITEGVGLITEGA